MKFFDDPRHKYIEFVEDGHKYWYYPSGDKRKTTERVEFKGITSWISQFCSKFDAEKMAAVCNKNPNSEWYGLGEDNIKKAWKKKGDDSLKFGNGIHNGVDNFVKTGEVGGGYFDYVDKFWNLMVENNIELLASEFVIYNEDIKRATPIDVIGKKDGILVPLDIKTFKDGMQYSSYNGKTMKYPLEDLQESKYDKVSLQISIERVFMEDKYNTETADGFCVLLNENECKLIPVKDYREYVRKMIEFDK